MNLHVHYPTRDEILPPGVTDGESLLAHYPRLRAKKFGRYIASRPAPKTHLEPEPEPEPLYTDLVQEDPIVSFDEFPFNSMIGIMRAVLRASSMSHTDLMSRRRNKEIMLPRQTFCYLARTRTAYSLPAIGRFIGGRDHSSILSGFRRVQCVIEANDLTINPDISHDEAARAILQADWSRVRKTGNKIFSIVDRAGNRNNFHAKSQIAMQNKMTRQEKVS